MNRDFVKLWTGETVSLIGTQVTQLALPLLAILTLHAGVLELGFLNASRYAPVVVCSLVAGVWLDRRRRRPTLVAADIASAALIGLIPLGAAFGGLSMGLLYAVALLAGAAQVFFDIGALSYLPGLVPASRLAAANGRMQVSYSLAGIAGPSLAGLLIGVLGAPVTLTVDAASYLVSMVMLLTIRRPEPLPVAPAGDRPALLASVREGLRAVFGSRLLRALLAQSCVFNLLYNALITIFLVYAVRRLGLDSTQLGLVIGAGAVAALPAALAATRVTTVLGLGRGLLLATLGACLSPLLLLIPRGATPAGLLVLAGAQAVYGACVVVYNVTTVTLRQIVTPNHLLARMNGSYRMLLFGTGPVGALAGGVLGAVLGLRPALVVAAVALTAPSAWLLFSPVYRLRRMPDGPPAIDASHGMPSTEPLMEGQIA